jgi:[ribosomal protein S5]-alanine N-acetyltransferase
MLVGRHLRLQPWTIADAPRVAEWFGDPAYLGDYYNLWPLTQAAAERRIAEIHGSDQHAFFAVRQETDEFVGTAGYWNPYSRKYPEMFRGLELWWHVHPSARRQGVARQAACLLVNHLFDATTIQRLQATIVVGNAASCRVAELAGLQHDGIYRKIFFLRGRYVDMHLYAITREDWQSERAYREGRPEF